MEEVYVDNVIEYSRHRKKDAAWQKIKSDLMESEKRMREEGGIRSGQLRNCSKITFNIACLFLR